MTMDAARFRELRERFSRAALRSEGQRPLIDAGIELCTELAALTNEVQRLRAENERLRESRPLASLKTELEHLRADTAEQAAAIARRQIEKVMRIREAHLAEVQDFLRQWVARQGVVAPPS